MSHGCHSYQKESDTSMKKNCLYPPSHHALLHWKFLLRCCSNLSQIDLQIQELDKHHSNRSPTINLYVYLSPQYTVLSAQKTSTGWKSSFWLMLAWSFFCVIHKNIHKKWACYDVYIYCWLSHKFLHPIDIKISVLPLTFTYSRDTSLRKRKPRII